MRKKIIHGSLFVFILLLLPVITAAQSPIAAGPMQGYTTSRSVRVWLLIHGTDKVSLQHETASGWSAETTLHFSRGQGWRGYFPVVYEMNQLIPGKMHKLRVNTDLGNKEYSYMALPEDDHRDFSFLLGSCAFIGTGAEKLWEINPPVEIFTAMKADPHDFMLWMGDNVYYIWPEYNTAKGMVRKQTKIRLRDDVGSFIGEGMHIAGWDDHDYGPNNSDGQYRLKDTALAVFRRFWATPSSNPGNYYRFTYSDADFYILDDRYNRDNANHTEVLGKVQMDWLKSELKASRSTFRFIILGSQVINAKNPSETWAIYEEQKQFIEWLGKEHITGVIFLTGDRHFAELHKMERPGTYPLLDLTCSPITSFLRKMDEKDPEWINPTRVEGKRSLQHNYGKISLSGTGDKRACHMQVMDVDGKQLWDYTVTAGELK